MRLDFSPRQRSLFCVYSAVLIDMLGNALTLPTMPFYAQELGASPVQLGNIFSAFAITQVISQAWMGYAGDKIGRRAVLLIALIGPSFGFAASALAWDFWSLMFARAFLGLVSGCIATANAYVAEIVPKDERARLMAGLGAMTSMAFLFGPPIGSALAQFGLTAPFWVGCVTSMIAAVVAYFNLLSPEDLDNLDKRQEKESAGALFKRMSLVVRAVANKDHGSNKSLLSQPSSRSDVLRSSAVRKSGRSSPSPAKPPAAAAPPKEAEWKMIALIAGAAGIITMSGSTMLTCTALFLQARLKWSELELGFVMMAQGAIGFGVQVVVFPACTKTFGILGTAIFSSSCLAIGQFGLSMLGGIPFGMSRILGFTGAQSFFALGYILSSAVVSPALADRAGSDNLGRVVSIGAMVQSCGRILGPLILGAAFEASPDLPYAIAGALAAIGATLWAITRAVGDPKTKEKEEDLEKKARKEKRETAIAALQKELKELLTTRGFDLEDDKSIDCLFKALDKALPEHGVGRSSFFYHSLSAVIEEEEEEMMVASVRRSEALVRRQSSIHADGL